MRLFGRKLAGRPRGWLLMMLVVGALQLPLLAPHVGVAQGSGHGESPLDRGSLQDSQIELTLEPVVSGVPDAVYVAEAPDDSGRLFVVSRDGLIFVAQEGVVAGQPFLDIQHLVVSDGGEMGLFSIAFHPNYAENGHFFVAFTSVDDTNAVMRFTVSEDPNVADPNSGVTVLALPDRAPIFHNGGMLAFGPDGYLYFGSGDEGITYDRDGNAQSLQSLFGKILRINPSVELGVAEGEAYTIPPDNPYVGREDARGEIWASGLRNPWRFSFDRETGDLYIADVGQDTYEEVNFQPASSTGGENYGWNQMEASHCFPLDTECDTSQFTLPILEYSHEERGGCAAIGGYVYRGTESPALIGTYLFADICTGEIWGAKQDANGEWQRELLLETDLSITSFAEDQNGELYITSFQNPAVRKIVATSDQPVPPNQPAFDRTWARTDQPVATGEVSRTWIWGPQDSAVPMVEPYAEAPNGERAVRYYDKARMEITSPDADPNSLWYVTNGLLVVEMMTGMLQTGHDAFEPREPADISAAGDPGAGPTYRVLGELRAAADDRVTQPVIDRLGSDGAVTPDEALAEQGVSVAAHVSETGHNIAAPFWEFMNSSGLVWEDGALVEQRLFDNPFYATGLPVTEPYWTDVEVAGSAKLVLLQCFERRCLTYTPDNPEGWQVEAGNVGRHYYDWRYAE